MLWFLPIGSCVIEGSGPFVGGLVMLRKGSQGIELGEVLRLIQYMLCYRCIIQPGSSYLPTATIWIASLGLGGNTLRFCSEAIIHVSIAKLSHPFNSSLCLLSRVSFSSASCGKSLRNDLKVATWILRKEAYVW